MQTQLPQIYIPKSDRKRLLRLASDAYADKERTAPFLSAELRRAQYCEPAQLPLGVVEVGRRVSYQLDGGPPSPPYELVHPDAFTGAPGQISLLSPTGVALLGLPVGANMPVFIPDKGFRTLSPVEVW